MKSVGITALALRALLESPEHYAESDGAFITRPVAYLLANAKSDGSIASNFSWFNPGCVRRYGRR